MLVYKKKERKKLVSYASIIYTKEGRKPKLPSLSLKGGSVMY